MENGPSPISLKTLLAAPFFVIEGPGGRRLCCQWTNERRHQGENEFEIICPDTPIDLDAHFGLFDSNTGIFKMRPSTISPRHSLDQDWLAGPNCILDSGYDWRWSKQHHHLEICPAGQASR